MAKRAKGEMVMPAMGAFSLAAVLVWVLAHAGDFKAGPPTLKFIAGVESFLEGHGEYGSPVSTVPLPDWAYGERQRVSFETGRTMLFYTKNGRVITVYEDAAGGRRKIWGEYDR